MYFCIHDCYFWVYFASQYSDININLNITGTT